MALSVADLQPENTIRESNKMDSFFDGFEKQALYGTRTQEDVAAGAAGLVPLGTSIHSAIADRPKDHSRFKEWGTRVGLGIGGAVLGSAIGGRSLGGLGATAGSVAGNVIGSRMTTGKYYNKDGTLKSKKELAKK